MSKKKPTNPQRPRDLVPVGSKHVQIKYHRKRDENGLKPSTSRALVLRNGKYGARGTGEVILAGRISGREKLDLLAGAYISSLLTQRLTAPRGPHITEITYRSHGPLQAGQMHQNRQLAIQWYVQAHPSCSLPLTLFKLTSTTLPISRTLTCSTVGSWPSWSQDLPVSQIANNLFGTLHTSLQLYQQGIGFDPHYL